MTIRDTQRSGSDQNSPLHLVVGAGGEGRALQHLPHLLSAETKVVDGPHVGELHDFDLKYDQTGSILASTLQNKQTNKEKTSQNV